MNSGLGKSAGGDRQPRDGDYKTDAMINIATTVFLEPAKPAQHPRNRLIVIDFFFYRMYN